MYCSPRVGRKRDGQTFGRAAHISFDHLNKCHEYKRNFSPCYRGDEEEPSFNEDLSQLIKYLTHYPAAELKTKSHILEQFKRRRQSAPAQPSSFSLCLWTYSYLTHFMLLNRSPPNSKMCASECTSRPGFCKIKSQANLLKALRWCDWQQFCNYW